jgi:hypothetical protein
MLGLTDVSDREYCKVTFSDRSREEGIPVLDMTLLCIIEKREPHIFSLSSCHFYLFLHILCLIIHCDPLHAVPSPPFPLYFLSFRHIFLSQFLSYPGSLLSLFSSLSLPLGPPLWSSGYRSRGPGSNPGAARFFSEK